MRLSHALALTAAAMAVAGTACSDPATPTIAVSVDHRLVRLSATDLIGIAGEEVTPAPEVQVLDRAAVPVAGALVTFQIVEGGGSLASQTVRSDASGLARPDAWILGAEPGLNVLRATLPEAPSASVEFSATGQVRCAAPCATGHPLAFVRAGDIYATTEDGSSVVRLTSSGDFGQPAWSPDGRRIAFVRDPAGAPTIYVLDMDGSPSLRAFARGSSPAWSPDGRHIAYAQGRIIVRSTDPDAAPAWAIGSALCCSGWPAWSPDGRRIAFEGDWAAPGVALDVYVAEVDGSDVVQLTDGFKSLDEVASFSQPAWSPDGHTLAVVGYWNWDDRNSWLEVMDLNGAASRLLASGSGLERPAWTPDGSLVVFARTCGTQQCPFDIYGVKIDGTGERLLLRDGQSPAWRPQAVDPPPTRVAWASSNMP